MSNEYNVSIKSLITGRRVALNLLGDDYVEVVPDEELVTIASRQVENTHGKIHGEPVLVTLPERSDDDKVVGRFGWKAQHASLYSASAEALYGELGVPNPYFPLVASSQTRGRFGVQLSSGSPELDSLVRFLRSTEPVSPDPARSITEAAMAGSKIFDKIGCAICHVRTLRTATSGTTVEGGRLIVPKRLGDRDIHPFSDFLLHDVGTGDGIIQNIRPQDYDETTADKFRTAPLWGLRYRDWLMHDGKSHTYQQAIVHHSGEASEVIEQYGKLSSTEKEQLLQFMDSL